MSNTEPITDKELASIRRDAISADDCYLLMEVHPQDILGMIARIDAERARADMLHRLYQGLTYLVTQTAPCDPAMRYNAEECAAEECKWRNVCQHIHRVANPEPPTTKPSSGGTPSADADRLEGEGE